MRYSSDIIFFQERRTIESIIFENVSKVYRLRGRGPTLYETATKLVRSLSRGEWPRDPELWALRDVSFSVEPGEALGVIGPNGAGKTTLLRLLAGVAHPTRGHILTKGQIAPLIQLGAGFHPELTGRENIYLNGIILGMTRREIERKFEAIVGFAELDEFLDTPVKHYSSGMYARLGFATAIHCDPGILLVDEVLAVGDFAFQQKCLERMEAFKEGGTTIIFVSHNLEMVSRLCSRTILLYQGKVIEAGPTGDVIPRYFEVYSKDHIRSEDEQKKAAQIRRVELLNSIGRPTAIFQAGEEAVLRVSVDFLNSLDDVVFGFFVRRPDRLLVLSTPSNNAGIHPKRYEKGASVEFTVTFCVNLLSGIYNIGTQVTNAAFDTFYDYFERAVTMTVHDNHSHGGVADLQPQYKLISYEMQR